MRGQDKGRQGEQQRDGNKLETFERRGTRRNRHWYGRLPAWVSVCLSLHYPSTLCPVAVCTCALPKTSNPLFPKWQSWSGPGCWFSGLIIKDYWHSGEVWLACDRLALILTKGRGMTGIWTPVKTFFCLRAITMWRYFCMINVHVLFTAVVVFPFHA